MNAAALSPAEATRTPLESLAIVIASKDREADIGRALRSIRAQPTQPERVIVVDQSKRPYDLLAGNGLLHHYDPAIRGLTAARNAGIAMNDCAIVLFIDDDVEVTSDVVSLVREALHHRPDAIGVQCDVLFPPRRTQVEPPGLGARIWEPFQRLFWRGFFDPRIIPKQDTGELGRVNGCAMAFRAALFEDEKFDEQLVDYSFGEDWEFSKRARRHGRLYLVHGATIIHHESPANRGGRMFGTSMTNCAPNATPSMPFGSGGGCSANRSCGCERDTAFRRRAHRGVAENLDLMNSTFALQGDPMITHHTSTSHEYESSTILGSLAIVIASKNRPADIDRALRSIRAQPTQPDRIIVVDQSEQPYDLPPGNDLLHHYDPAIPGLTVARTVG